MAGAPPPPSATAPPVASSASPSAPGSGRLSFAGVSLKKVERPSDRSVLLMGGNNRRTRIDAEVWNETNMELWYYPVEEITFKTKFIPLDIATAQAFSDVIEFDGEKPQSAAQKKLFANLERLIDSEIASLGSKGAFVKLSCRSPKDATVTSDKMQKIYQEGLAAKINHSENDKICGLYAAHLKALNVSSGKEAIDLFLKSSRIKTDLEIALKAAAGDESKFEIQVIIREWKEILIQHEFRGFVTNNKLNALSQYFDVCYFPDLVRDKADIAEKIQTFFTKEVTKRVQFRSDYIVDFCIAEDKVWIIELNPFNYNTDSCLFSWKKDVAILEGTNTAVPFEFRVLEKPYKNVVFYAIKPWKKYFTT
eukprot:TRINITY_DN10087_c0_g1_i1.p1 TRINITY_DN10087_c0_g1~~TRINITY_DN10087_c0_g1_i1.p1  ORF type:complete len:365 (-),score=63.79 TRINITY_DN10087_c0_g1_i1:6-1100(-)